MQINDDDDDVGIFLADTTSRRCVECVVTMNCSEITVVADVERIAT